MGVYAKRCMFSPRTVQYAVARWNNPAQDRPVSPYSAKYRKIIHPTHPSTAPLKTRFSANGTGGELYTGIKETWTREAKGDRTMEKITY
jgi:hypothetical protein